MLNDKKIIIIDLTQKLLVTNQNQNQNFREYFLGQLKIKNYPFSSIGWSKLGSCKLMKATPSKNSRCFICFICSSSRLHTILGKINSTIWSLWAIIFTYKVRSIRVRIRTSYTRQTLTINQQWACDLVTKLI